MFSTLKVRESEWPGGLNLTNSSKANQPMWSSSWPSQPLRSNQLINCWGSHNTHENQTRYLCLPRNLCKGYYIPISLCTKLIILANYQTALVKIEKYHLLCVHCGIAFLLMTYTRELDSLIKQKYGTDKMHCGKTRMYSHENRLHV